MFKKPVISKEAQVLLKLLRIALGTEPCGTSGEPIELFPEGIDWKKVVRLSYEQKVSALAVDGLEASKYDPYKGLDERQAEELKAVLVPWVKDVENTEWSYCYYVEVLKTLCQIFKDNGLTPIVLKGYGLSLNYPKPSHRGAGDIDIYFVDDTGKQAAELGDQIASDIIGLKVKKERDGHHSTFFFKGILVENHYELRGHLFNDQNETRFLHLLKQMVTEQLIPFSDIPGAFFPNDTFNVLFLMRHTIGSIYAGCFNLRQLCDLIIFLKSKKQEIDWEKVDSILKEAQLERFAIDVNGLIYKCFCYKVREESYAMESANSILVRKLLNPINNGDTLFGKISFFCRNSWKYRYFFKKSWIEPLIKAISQHLVNKYSSFIIFRGKIHY